MSHYRPPRTLVLVDALSEFGGRQLLLDDEGRWTVVDVHRGQRSTNKCLTLGKRTCDDLTKEEVQNQLGVVLEYHDPTYKINSYTLY